MIVKEEDKFFKMMCGPQTCDYCMHKNQPIAHLILHPLFSMEKDGRPKMIGYTVAKKCMPCIEEQFKDEE